MKKFIALTAILAMLVLSGCTQPTGPSGITVPTATFEEKANVPSEFWPLFIQSSELDSSLRNCTEETSAFRNYPGTGDVSLGQIFRCGGDVKDHLAVIWGNYANASDASAMFQDRLDRALSDIDSYPSHVMVEADAGIGDQSFLYLGFAEGRPILVFLKGSYFVEVHAGENQSPADIKHYGELLEAKLQ